MRFLYDVFAYLLLIPFAIYWLVKGVGNRTYLDRLQQRFGFGFPKLAACNWVHAVSVGEVQAAVPLVRELIERFPDRKLLITTVTPTGAARVRSLFGDSVVHCYIPFEFPNAIWSFFSSVKPSVALIMETEIWPNLYRGCGVRSIPLVLVSARISPRSVPGYRRWLPLIRDTLSHGIIIAAQSEADAARFLEIGANPERTRVTGNIKFDMQLDASIASKGGEIRSTMFDDRPVWVAASTHEGEEEQVLDAHRSLIWNHPDLLLVLIPRHPERFDGVKELIHRRGFEFVTRTGDQHCLPSTQVLLVDTMGEVPLFYAASDVAFVGGSLVPVGGHNLLEPAAQGLPIVTGPHLFNAQEISDEFRKAGACTVIANSDELALEIARLLDNPDDAHTMGDNGLAVLNQNKGALARLLVLLDPLLSGAATKASD